MRKLLMSLVMFCLLIPGAMAVDDFWMTDFDAACKLAAKEKKLMLVDFSGSDWCMWCIRLDKEVFSTPEFRKYCEKVFVPVLIDFPSDTASMTPAQIAANRKLATKYEVRGFPTVLIMNSDGKVLGTTGYQRGGVANYIKHLEQLVDQIKKK